MVSVTPIGTCRISNPLKRGEAKYGYRLNTVGTYGYTHSSAEAVQQVSSLLDGYTPAPQCQPLVMPNFTATGAKHSLSDLYFVEISSSKILNVGSDCVQLNYVTRYFESFFKDRDRAKQFWQLAENASPARKYAFLASDTAYRSLSTVDRAILRNLTIRHSTYSSLASDIRLIMGRLPRVVFVTHFDAYKSTGSLLSTRSRFKQLLISVLDDLGADYFDPTSDVSNFGQGKALLDENDSLSHYSTEFEDLLIGKWSDEIIGRENAGVARQVRRIIDLAQRA